MRKQIDTQRTKLLLDAVRVVLHAKFTNFHDRGPALGFNGEESPQRALRLAREHLEKEGLQEEDVVWNGHFLASLLENGINHIDIVVTYPTQTGKAQAYIGQHGKATHKVPLPDIRIVTYAGSRTPGQVIEGRVQVPFNCDIKF